MWLCFFFPFYSSLKPLGSLQIGQWLSQTFWRAIGTPSEKKKQPIPQQSSMMLTFPETSSHRNSLSSPALSSPPQFWVAPFCSFLSNSVSRKHRGGNGCWERWYTHHTDTLIWDPGGPALNSLENRWKNNAMDTNTFQIQDQKLCRNLQFVGV